MKLLIRIAVLLMAMTVPGCALLSLMTVGELPAAKTDDATNASRGLDQRKESAAAVAPMVLRTVRLEASIVNRPVNDIRVRQLVWEELDESGLMSPSSRQQLNQKGFRIGVAGSAAPWVVQSLARDAAAATRSEGEAGQAMEAVTLGSGLGPSFSLLPNGKSYIEVQSQLDEARLPLDRIPELKGLPEKDQLRCVFEVSVRELSDVSAVLNFLPMVYCGTATPRLTIESTTDRLPVRQNVVALYEYQFEIRMLSGEVAVIGRQASASDDDWNLGNLFFQPVGDSTGAERLLMIRVAGLEQMTGVSDPQFQLRNHVR